MTLTWQPGGLTEDFDHYRIYRAAAADGAYQLIGQTVDTVFSDTTMPVNRDSLLCRHLLDDLGNESPMSNIVELRPGKILPAGN